MVSHHEPPMASSPRLPRYSESGAQFATILVGPEETPFVVHAALINHYSIFFKAALTGKFKEAEDQTVKLPDADPTTFEFFNFWLYHQRFPSEAHRDSHELLNMWAGEKGVRSGAGDQLIKLYMFGDQYQVAELRRHSLDGLLVSSRRIAASDLPYPGLVALAFDKLQHTSPLCRFLVDLFYFKSDKYCFKPEDEGEYPDSFLLAVLRRFASNHNVSYNKCSPDPLLRACDYHEHINDKEKAECTMR